MYISCGRTLNVLLVMLNVSSERAADLKQQKAVIRAIKKNVTSAPKEEERLCSHHFKCHLCARQDEIMMMGNGVEYGGYQGV